jgi:hypothetical protein
MAGDRVKTDRRDAVKLARSYRSGDLTPVWVPDAQHESLRDLIRAREAAKEDERRGRHRLGKYLLRDGQRPGDDGRVWTAAWWQRVPHLQLPHAEQNIVLLDHIMEVDHQSCVDPSAASATSASGFELDGTNPPSFIRCRAQRAPKTNPNRRADSIVRGTHSLLHNRS